MNFDFVRAVMGQGTSLQAVVTDSHYFPPPTPFARVQNDDVNQRQACDLLRFQLTVPHCCS
eukprot:scaffold12091_cov98-Skeletonema_marinoi.AAC.6